MRFKVGCLDFASAEGAGAFQDPPRPQSSDLSTDDELTQRKINCDGIITTSELLKKAIEDMARTERSRNDLRSNSDAVLDGILEKKIMDLTHQRNGLEEQKAYKRNKFK
ncbi:hypothetical protein CDAR_14651 [Caerostris darwini]|uniref:Uncharacterized protein n=1 Tax=Caerostris darwini TaxID=1538125 RepID=A0AAV4TA53_9ARAC|nr:hypothetical protein CDAR_14651 [Caerostris darwini]